MQLHHAPNPVSVISNVDHPERHQYVDYLMEGDRSWSDLVQARKCPKTTSGKGKLKKWLTSVRKDLN